MLLLRRGPFPQELCVEGGDRVGEKAVAHYSLEVIQASAVEGGIVLTSRVQRYLSRRGYATDVPVRMLALLEPRYLHKSQPHQTREGVWLDIYRPYIEGRRWYLKLALHEDGSRFVVLSCCLDGEAH